jgi:hypothetical protein
MGLVEKSKHTFITYNRLNGIFTDLCYKLGEKVDPEVRGGPERRRILGAGDGHVHLLGVGDGDDGVNARRRAHAVGGGTADEQRRRRRALRRLSRPRRHLTEMLPPLAPIALASTSTTAAAPVEAAGAGPGSAPGPAPLGGVLTSSGSWSVEAAPDGCRVTIARRP